MTAAKTISMPRIQALGYIRLALFTLAKPGDHLDVPPWVNEKWLRQCVQRMSRRTGLRYGVKSRPSALTVTVRVVAEDLLGPDTALDN